MQPTPPASPPSAAGLGAFARLPPHLFPEILKHADTPTIHRLSETSKAFHLIATADRLHPHTAELLKASGRLGPADHEEDSIERDIAGFAGRMVTKARSCPSTSSGNKKSLYGIKRVSSNGGARESGVLVDVTFLHVVSRKLDMLKLSQETFECEALVVNGRSTPTLM
ncbi:hypothetical protein RQP46_000076 [Phenoliferia psychrophenolica]